MTREASVFSGAHTEPL